MGGWWLLKKYLCYHTRVCYHRQERYHVRWGLWVYIADNNVHESIYIYYIVFFTNGTKLRTVDGFFSFDN